MMIMLLHLSTNLITDTKANGTKNGIKVAVPLKYLSNFWRLLEIPLINCKVEVSLKWIENCVLTAAAIGANATGADSATLKITDAKLYVPVFTLSTEDNVKLVKQLNEGFKRSVYWNKYKVIDNKVVETAAANEEKHIKELIDSSYQGAKRLFVLMIIQQMIIKSLMILLKNIFFQELKLKTATLKSMEENCYDQPINDSIKQYDEVRKISTGQGDDYTTGCLFDFAYFEKNYRLIAADLSKQKALDAN